MNALIRPDGLANKTRNITEIRVRQKISVHLEYLDADEVPPGWSDH